MRARLKMRTVVSWFRGLPFRLSASRARFYPWAPK